VCLLELLSCGGSPLLFGQNAKDIRASTININGNNASEIAAKLDSAITGISVKAMDPHWLLLTYSTDVPADNVTAITNIIKSLDGVPPELSSARVIRLYNLHQASTLAPSLNKLSGVDAKNIGDDVILLTGLENGREGSIEEAKRYIALLDSPRPEVTLNVWSVQVSSKDRDTIDLEGDSVRHVVALHNQQLHDSLEQGWKYLSHQIAAKGSTFFNTPFHDYVTDQFVSLRNAKCPDNDQACQAALPEPQWGQCSTRYCLGYAQAFEPLRPSLTTLLLTLAASANPAVDAENFVDCMESTGQCSPTGLSTAGTRKLLTRNESGFTPRLPAGTEARQRGEKSSKSTAFQQCFERYERVNVSGDCELDDYRELSRIAPGELAHSLKFACFRQQLRDSMGDPTQAAGSANELSSSRLGLLRSAIADFLFQYKFANQYPHEFIPYDYSKSGQVLDSEFDPLLVAFNRDVNVFLRHLQAELECRPHGKTSLRSNGIITVRTISEQKSTVDTKTANFFDVTPAPNLTDLIAGTKNASDSAGDVIAQQISPYQLQTIMAGLNAVKPVTSRIGRGLSLEVTPKSLLGASATELSVTLKNNEDSDGPKLLASDNSDKGPDAVSRVAQHDVTTNVRVEALKLFELSSFSATLNRGRKGFPILPPLVELPYVGSFARVPIPPGTMYHRSFAVISAIIVPTASDLANGITFASDMVLDACGPDTKTSDCDPHNPGTWPTHHAASMNPISKAVRIFHTQMLTCFASQNPDECSKSLTLERYLRNRGVATIH
jgi:hypothetical protein